MTEILKLTYLNRTLTEQDLENLCNEFNDYHAAEILAALDGARLVVKENPARVEIREGTVTVFLRNGSRWLLFFNTIDEMMVYQMVFNQLPGYSRKENTNWDGIWVDYTRGS